MADLTIPLRQTFPFIRGCAADEQGDMHSILAAAYNLTLRVDDGSGGTPLTLQVDVVAPGETMTVNGQTMPVNFESDYSASVLANAETNGTPWRGKLRVQHDPDGDYIQYVPRDGFFEVEIGPNVTEV